MKNCFRITDDKRHFFVDKLDIVVLYKYKTINLKKFII